MRTIKLITGLLLLILMGFTAPKDPEGFKISMFDELAPIYPDTKIEKAVTSYTVDVCRGSIAGVDILMTNLIPLEPIRFVLTGKGILDKFYANWYFLIDVPVTENTGLDSRTEKFSGETNPYVIRRAPFRIYEAMDPVQTGYIPATSTQALRMEIPIGKDFPTGKQLFTIYISSKGQVKKLAFTVNVYPVEIPPVNQSHLNYVNWLNLGNICNDHDVEIWSEPFWGMLRKYAQLMARGRQNTFWFIWSDFFKFKPDGSVAEFYEQRLDRYIDTFLSEGLTTIQGAPFARRRDWSSDAFLVAVPTLDGREIPAVSEEGQKIIRSMAGPIIALMKKNGWEFRWYQGVFDEPTDEYVDRYKTTVALLKSMKPDLRVLEATMTVSLSGIVDCWCPQVQEYQKNAAF
ncbi:MAG: glycoside hydrolase domain-containing protein, partial [Bacteroidales bacterium]